MSLVLLSCAPAGGSGVSLAGEVGASTGSTGSTGSAVTSPDPSQELPSFTTDPTENTAVGASGLPANLGTEQLCDGMDDNANGIIDDVDVGKDGLCDCLNIGFLGAFASDAGTATGAFETWLEERSNIPVVTIGPQAPVTAEILEPLQVLVVGNMTERVGAGFTPDEVAAIQQWVEQAGNGLITLGGYTATESHMAPTQQLLAPFGVSYDYVGRGSGVLGDGAPPVRVTGIVAPEHPSVEGVDAVGVYFGYPVQGDGQVILNQAGFDLAMAKVLGEGRVFVFADEWITQDLLWLPDTNQNLTPCQQQCRQCADECGRCEQQCLDCRDQPCNGGAEPDENGDCPRGCDQSCEMCGGTCTTCQGSCDTCMAAEPELDIPRFWLNVIRWLTPANECQVEIPPIIR